MSNQLQITGGAKVRALEGVITGTSGVLSSVPLGAANGVATLDSGGKVPVSQLPNSVMKNKGTWNVTTNTPYLVNGVGNAGDVYMVIGAAVGGTNHDFGSGNILFYNGDQAIYDGSAWQRASGSSGTVTSVAVAPGSSVSALSISGSPITNSGTITIDFAGTNLQYVTGSGGLTTFPSLTGYIPYTGATTAIDLNAKTVVNISNLGINTTTVPTILLRAIGDNNSGSRIAMRGYSSNANSSSIRVTKFRGTAGSPQAPLSGDSLGKFELAGYGTTSSDGYAQASFEGIATENWGATARGSKTVIKITPNTTITQAIALTINQDKSAVFENSVTATSLIKTGGTSSQFLKADGTVDSSSYITLASLSATSPLSYNNTTGAFTIAQATTSTSGFLSSTDWNTFNSKGSGTVTSVAMTVPTGLSISGSPITSSGTLAVTLTAGYSIPTTASQTNWDSAYTNRITSATAPLSIASNVISISDASASTSGVITTGTQTIAGSKTFNSAFTILSSSSTKFGALTLTNSASVANDNGSTVSFNINNNNAGIQQAAYILGYNQGSASNNYGNIAFFVANLTSTATTRVLLLDYTGASTFIGSVTATSFIKTSGTSSQFLKADGSVDSNTYLTTSSAASTYLPLAGGTLTGPLLGTSSTFTSIESTTYVQSKLGASNTIGSGSRFQWDNTLTSTAQRQLALQMNASSGLDFWAYNGSTYNNTGLKLNFDGSFNANAANFLGNVQLGTPLISTVTATPITINLGSTFSNTAGSNLKLRVYEDSSGGIYGIGVSGAQMDFNIPSGSSYKFFTGPAIFVNNITASSLIKSGGTSSQFLKADGSVDSTVYGTGSVTSVATTGPLTGGTITTTGTIGITQSTTSTSGYLSSTDWNTFNNKTTLPSLTSGSVLFSNGTTIAQNNSQFFWDNTNNRLGIGTSAPSVKLDIFGAGDGTYFNIQYSGGQLASIDAVGTSVSAHGVLNLGKAGTTNVVINGFGDSYFTGGNLGVGTNSPSSLYRLDVSGAGRFTGSLYGNGSAAFGTTTIRSVAGYNFISINGGTRGGYTDYYYNNVLVGSVGVEANMSIVSQNANAIDFITPSNSYSTKLSIANSGAATFYYTLGVNGVSTFSSNIYMQSSGNPSQLLAKGTNTEFWVDSQYGGGTARAFINRNGTGNQATLMFSTGIAITNGTAWAGACDYSMGVSNDGSGNFFIGAGDIFSSSNRAITITSSKSVGLNTSSPYSTSVLSLQESSTLSSALSMMNRNSNQRWLMAVDAFAVDDKYLSFIDATNSIVRMAIGNDGKIIMNQSTSYGAETLEITPKILGGTQYGIIINGSPASYTVNAMRFYYTGVAVVGSITFTTSTTSYNITSDYRLKQDYKDFNGMSIIDKIKIYDFEWKMDKSRMYGAIAHELQEILPIAVTGEKDAIDENGNIEAQGVDYSKIVPILVKAIQELKAEIEELKNK